MSNALQVITSDIYASRDAFQAALVDQSINFEREAGFACQILGSNEYLMKVAMANRQSLVDSVVNVAAIGISLNPAKKQAYLLPRKRKICLDISYIGMTDLAVASGSVRWVQADVVRQADGFQLNGYDKPPTHRFDPFARDRGEVVGAYVVAKTADGDFLTDVMNIDEIHAIRDRSEAWKSYIAEQKKCPWVTDPAEMNKKTVVKRASKLWPKCDRLALATHYLNTDGGEGIAFEAPPAPANEAEFDLSGWIVKIRDSSSAATLNERFSAALEQLTKSYANQADKRVRDAGRELGEKLQAAARARRDELRNDGNTFEHERKAA
ncbi:MAG: recombinase RecT [Burkholderiales bacterium]